MLHVFQSIQKKGIPFMLVLTGLPTLFPKLVDARTYAERMFRVMTLSKLSSDESREAILNPIEHANCPIKFVGNSANSMFDAAKLAGMRGQVGRGFKLTHS